MMRSRFKDSRRPYFWCEQRLLDLGLSPAEIAVYCLLAAKANQQDQCWPSYQDITKRLHIGRRTAIRAIKRLHRLCLIKKTSIKSATSDYAANIYELVDIPEQGGGATVAPGGDKSDTGVVPNGHRGWCHQSTSNKEPLNKDKENKGGQTTTDPQLEDFAGRFKRLYGHRPQFTKKQRETWRQRRADCSEAILKAKIAGWWEFPLPPTFTGNRTFGAFLQWFDDIPVNGTSVAAPGVVRTPEEWLVEMKTGSAVGRRHYHDVIGGITDPAAKIRTLEQLGEVHDDNDARSIIRACDTGGR